MTETERMQQLHQLAATGHALTGADKAALATWYETLDREEAAINRNNRVIGVAELREKVAARTAQITIVSEEVVALLKQNEALRGENVVLRRQLEARLRERQAA